MLSHPLQPLVKDEHGVLRFKDNAIVRHLMDTHPDCDMNRLAGLEFTDDDRRQFAQLIGYSFCGFGELSYVDAATYAAAEAAAVLLDPPKPSGIAGSWLAIGRLLPLEARQDGQIG